MTDLLLTLAVLLLAANLVATLWVNERIRYAINRLAQEILEIGLARLEAKRAEIIRAVSVQREEIVPKLGQLALEATGESAGIDQVIKVVTKPFPAIVALGRDFAQYVFSPTPPEVVRKVGRDLLGERPSKVPVFSIDAAVSSLTATAELSAIWHLLAEDWQIPVEERAIQRSVRWYLYVVPAPRGK